MEIISRANKTVLSILKKFNDPTGTRMLRYCVETPVEGGVLLFNLLTRELLLLTREEYDRRTELDYLRRNWFVVPEGTKEKELADLVRWVLKARAPKPEAIKSYTIFSTTDCNARCFYCFELGCSRVPMSQEIARKTARYVIDHCGGKKVTLTWFGGEPLFNQPAIDTICTELRREGVEFVSKAISNGYLFDAETVKKAVERWNLKRVQITLDGTETVYNRTKAFIYREGSPYRVVLANMERLLDAGIAIQVRLNMDLYNADDLVALVEELARRFSGRPGLMVYAHHIWKGDQPMAELHSPEEWQKREEAMVRLTDTIARCGLEGRSGIGSALRMNYCMADSGRAVTITPTGDIGLCEHFSESEFIGHIDREGFDEQVVAGWRERLPEIPECLDCFYYPVCNQPKKCPNNSVCFSVIRNEKLRQTRRQMRCEYDRWLSRAEPDEFEDADQC